MYNVDVIRIILSEKGTKMLRQQVKQVIEIRGNKAVEAGNPRMEVAT